uniref:Uncharacterized protein n=1 Tax=Macrostomum lignano TaxID=282301 RepID=A0A1I8FEQ4_9PLAT
MDDYDRRNDDIRPVEARRPNTSFEKRLEKMEMVPVQLDKGATAGWGLAYWAWAWALRLAFDKLGIFIKALNSGRSAPSAMVAIKVLIRRSLDDRGSSATDWPASRVSNSSKQQQQQQQQEQQNQQQDRLRQSFAKRFKKAARELNTLLFNISVQRPVFRPVSRRLHRLTRAGVLPSIIPNWSPAGTPNGTARPQLQSRPGNRRIRPITTAKAEAARPNREAEKKYRKAKRLLREAMDERTALKPELKKTRALNGFDEVLRRVSQSNSLAGKQQAVAAVRAGS